MAAQLLGLHNHLARQQLLAFHQQNAHNHAQEEQIILKCSECQYTTTGCRDLWTAITLLQSQYRQLTLLMI